MDDTQLNLILDIHENEYAKEAEDRWGNTEAYRESQKRVSKMSKDDMKKVLKEQSDISIELAKCMKDGLGIKSPRVQELIKRHYNWLKNFYEPNKEMYVGLANMYLDDPRFAKNYNDIEPGLAKYMSDAMKEFASTN
jgi:hypothetical protein